MSGGQHESWLDEKGRMNFRCCECGDRAAWGEGVSLRKGVVGKWYCKDCVEDRLRYPEGRKKK
jgi:hypothetical protein